MAYDVKGASVGAPKALDGIQALYDRLNMLFEEIDLFEQRLLSPPSTPTPATLDRPPSGGLLGQLQDRTRTTLARTDVALSSLRNVAEKLLP